MEGSERGAVATCLLINKQVATAPRSETMNFKIEERKITPAEYQFLRATTDWKIFEISVVKKALENDLYSICVFNKDKLIGMGRVIGDGAIYFYLQDIIVHPDYQGRGVGALIMDRIESFLHQHAFENSFIGLMAAGGVKDFYKRYDYLERPKDRPGMYKLIKK